MEHLTKHLLIDPELEPFNRLADVLTHQVSLLLREGASPQLPDGSPVRTVVPDPAEYDKYYGDDRHLTAATLQLHPSLVGSGVAQDIFTSILPQNLPDGRVGDSYKVGNKFPEYADPSAPSDLPAGLHLILEGTMRLFAVTRKKGIREPLRREIVQYRTGQWMGFPNLLWRGRESMKAVPLGDLPAEWPDFEETTLEAVAASEVRTQYIPEDRALELLKNHGRFRLFATLHVLIRLARRQEIVRLFMENPVLRLLPARDREYLMQLGALIHVEGDKGVKYLEAGKPSFRTALILNGSARAHTPGTAGLMATFEKGDLIGHEAIAATMVGDRSERELEKEVEEKSRVMSVKLPPFKLREPERTTEVRLAPGTEILEFDWYALRWTLDDNDATWSRVKSVLSPDANASMPPPRVVCVQGAHATEERDSDLLAYGLATALALDTEKEVYLIDLHGEDNLTAWFGSGLLEEAESPSRSLARQWRMGRNLDPQDTRMFSFMRARQSISVGRGKVNVLCPSDPVKDDIGQLVEYARSQEKVSYVVVSSRRWGKEKALDEAVAGWARILNGISHEVFYVTDNGDAKYDFSGDAVEPSSLTWVYWMNSRYVTRERKRARRERLDWGLKNTLFTPEQELPYLPVKQQVRVVPHETSAALFINAFARELFRSQASRGFEKGSLLDHLGEPPLHVNHPKRGREERQGQRPHKLSPLARAFRRMARVVERRTVGLALSGGGAWGFAHVALIEELEETGVPIDYVAGASIGAIIGSIYVNGGTDALEKLLQSNAADSWWGAVSKDSLLRAVHLSSLSSLALERYIDAHIQEWTRSSDTPCLSTTEIPFFPVGTDLMTHQSVFNLRTTTGWGVRMSGSFPPLVASLPVGEHRIVDGAFSDNVPCRIARTVGAYYVIASNVVPSAPPKLPPGSPLSGMRAGVRQVRRLLLGRLEDSLRGSFIQGYIAGNDQGKLAADVLINLHAGNAHLFELWKGPEIKQFSRKHLQQHLKEAGSSILERWSAFNPPAAESV